jgi:tetratricopeptide (TPR) repeat protein
MSNNNNPLLPIDRAGLYFDRARQLSLFCCGSSLELERLLREIYKALSYDNEEVKFYLLLGKIYKLNLDITSAMFCYRFILKKNSGMIAARKFLIELLVLKGKEYMKMGSDMKWKAKFTAARSCFDEALEYNRENYDLWILKSICHVQCNELTEAFEAVSKVIRPNRELNAEVYILRAKINWGRGLTEQGNQDIRFAASLDPNHPEVLGFIARSYAKSELLYKEALVAFADEKFKESLELVNHALHITGEDVKLYILKSRIFRMLHELQSAYESIMKARSIFEDKYEEDSYQLNLPPEILIQTNLVLNEMAINYAIEGNYHNAILLYNKILRSEETLNQSLMAVYDRQLKEEQGRQSPNTQQTSILYKTGRGAAQNQLTINYKYYMNRGDCYRALSQFNDAIYDYQKAIEIEPTDWTIRTKLSLTHYMIATNYFNNSSFLDADIELTRAINFNPKVSEYYSLRGKAKYYLSDFLAAHSDFKKALELDPNNVDIKLRLQQFEDLPEIAENDKKNNKSRSGVGELTITGGKGSKSTHSKRVPSPKRASSPDSPKSKSSQVPHSTTTTASMDPVQYTKEQLQRSLEKEEMVEELLLQARYKTDQKVMKLQVRETDYITMMLNRKITTKLPTLKLMTTEMEEEKRRLRINHHNNYQQEMEAMAVVTTKDHQEVTLPKILTKSQFLPAHIAKLDVHAKNSQVQRQFSERSGIERGELWGIVDTAKEIVMAKAQAKLKVAADKAAKVRSASLSSSSANSSVNMNNTTSTKSTKKDLVKKAKSSKL